MTEELLNKGEKTMKTITLNEKQVNDICTILAKANHPNISWESVNNVIAELQKGLEEPKKK